MMLEGGHNDVEQKRQFRIFTCMAVKHNQSCILSNLLKEEISISFNEYLLYKSGWRVVSKSIYVVVKLL